MPVGGGFWLGFLILATLGRASVQAQDRPDRIRWDPGASGPAQPLALRAAPVRLVSEQFLGGGALGENLARAESRSTSPVETHLIVQFAGVPSPPQRRALEALGVRLLDYLPEGAFFARVPRGTDPNQLSALGVRWLGPIYPEDKLARSLRTGTVGPWALQPDGTARLRVSVFTDVTVEIAAAQLTAAGAALIEVAAERSLLTVDVAPGRIPELAQLDAMRWLEEIPPPAQPFVDGIRTNTQAEVVQVAPYGRSGAGVTVGIWDVGLADTNHTDLAGRLTIAETNSAEGVRAHATHVAGIVGGSGELSAAKGGYVRQWRGQAPAATLISWDTHNAVAEHKDAIENRHVAVSQNSWGVQIDAFFGNCNLYGDYNNDAPAFDRLVNGSLYGGRLNAVFAAGNARKNASTNGCAVGPYFTIGPPATAKNPLTVGAINSDDHSMTSFSSWGPLDDGRLKPDLVAPGAEVGGDHGIMSTTTGNQYSVLIGTSMATPAVSGAIALLLEEYRARLNDHAPRPCLVKALLLHTALDLDDATPWYNPGPDFASGYGRLQIRAALDQVRADGFLVGRVAHGEVATYTLPVPAGAPALKVTLAWDDVAAAENAAVALVNDLDLVVLDPLGQPHLPWTLDPVDPSAAAVRTRPDRLNVVEQVQLASPPLAGDWVVRVVGQNVPAGGAQSFALAYSPATIPQPALLEFERARFDDATAGDQDGAIDPGETIYQTVVVRHVDGPAVTAVTARLETESPGVRLLQTESAYPDFLPGTTRTNLTPFAYRVGRDIACGTTLHFRQILSSGLAQFTNHFSHVVGTLGVTNDTVRTFESGNVPQDIPDGGAVASKLTVATPGTIVDVNVSFRIDHPYLDDLRLELEHPDGTRVMLVRPFVLAGQNFGQGPCGDWNQRTRLDDQAPGPIRNGAAPFVGAFRPDDPLAVLHGKPVAGDWKLVVADTSLEDVGTLQCWGLELSYQQEGYTCQVFNRPPQAQGANLIVVHNQPLPLQLPAQDPDLDPLRFALLDLPAHGTVSGFDPATGTLVYTPALGYIGPDRLTFQVDDGLATTPLATVDLEVQEPRAELRLESTSIPATVVLGHDLAFTFAVRNAGPNAATSVRLVQSLSGPFTIVSAESTEAGVTVSEAGVTLGVNTIPVDGAVNLAVVVRPNDVGNVVSVTTVTANELDRNLTDNTVVAVSAANYAADLALTKTASAAQALVASPLTYQLEVANRGPHDATQVQLTDRLPDTLELLDVTLSQGTHTVADGAVSCDLGSLAAGTTALVTLRTVPRLAGQVTNTAHLTSPEFDLVPENNVAHVVTTVGLAADLAVTKTASHDPAILGQQLSYTVTVTNRGPNTATGVTLIEQVPAGTLFPSVEDSPATWIFDGTAFRGTLPDLAPNDGLAFRFHLIPPQPGILTNRALALAHQADPDPTNSAVTNLTHVRAAADLAVRKSADPSPAALNLPLRYTLTVDNLGPHEATGVRLTDRLPSGVAVLSAETTQGTVSVTDGVVTGALGAMRAGATAIVAVVVTPTELGLLTNLVQVAADEVDPHLADNAAEVTTDVRLDADLELALTATPDPVILGQEATFLFSIANRGPHPATNVRLQGQLPVVPGPSTAVASQGTATLAGDELTAQLGELAPGETATVRVTLTPAAAGDYQGSGTALAHETDLDPANNSAQASARVRPQADLALRKVAHQPTVLAGGQLTYTLAVTNQGPHAATGIVLTDPLPPGTALLSAAATQGTATQDQGIVQVALGDLAPGASATATLVVQPTLLGPLTNVAQVVALERDPAPHDNTAQAAVDVLPSADLALASEVLNPPVVLGRPFTILVRVTNRGPVVAADVSLLNSVGPGLVIESATATPGIPAVIGSLVTVAFGELVVGRTAELRVTLRPTAPGTWVNVATARSGLADPNAANNATVATGNVAQEANLAVAKTASTPTARVGDEVTYSVLLTNLGPATATAVTLTDRLPAELELLASETSQGSVQIDGPVVQFELGNLPVGTVATAVLRTRARAGGTLTNTVWAASAEADPDPTDNSASAVTAVQESADLTLTKTASNTVVGLDQSLRYTLTVTNQGPSRATALTLTDRLPDGVELATVTVSQGQHDASPGTVVAHLGELAPGATATLTVEVLARQLALLTNSAMVAAAQLDPNPADNAAEVVTEVRPQADLVLRAVATPESLLAGQNITYLLTVQNLGPSEATAVTLDALLGGGAAPASTRPSQGLVQADLPLLTWNVGSLPSGAEATLEAILQTAALGEYVHTAVVRAAELDPHTADNTAVSVNRVLPRIDLELTGLLQPSVVTVSNGVTCILLLRNIGPEAAPQTRVDLPLPPGVTMLAASLTQGTYTQADNSVQFAIGQLRVGAVASVAVSLLPTQPGSWPLTAEATAAGVDARPANNTFSARLTARALTDLAVTKQALPEPVYAGRDFTYTLVVTNLGPATATEVTLVDAFPDSLRIVSVAVPQGTYEVNAGVLTCRLGDLTVTGQLVITVVANPNSVGLIHNTVTVQSAEVDPAPANNTATTTTTVLTDADLKVTLSVHPDPVAVGATLTYTATVENLGPSPATRVLLVDVLPTTLAYVSASSSQGTVDFQAGVLTANLELLPVGASATVTLVATPLALGELTHSVAVNANEIDLKPGNNAATATVRVLPVADLALAKTADRPTAVVGQPLEYTLSVTNLGPDLAEGVVLQDPLPAGLTVLALAASQGTVTAQAGVVQADLGALPALSAAQVTVLVSPTAFGTVTNTASLTAQVIDPVPANDLASLPTLIYPEADLLVQLTASPDPVLIHNKATHAISVVNRGAQPVPAVSVLAAFSLNVDLLSASVSQGNARIEPPGVVCDLGNLPPGATASATIVVKANTLAPVICQATAHSPATGPNNPNLTARTEIRVVATPTLVTERSGNRFDLIWPATANDFLLESTDDLAQPEWIEVRNPRVLVGDQVTVTLKLSGPGRFYRLRKP